MATCDSMFSFVLSQSIFFFYVEVCKVIFDVEVSKNVIGANWPFVLLLMLFKDFMLEW